MVQEVHTVFSTVLVKELVVEEVLEVLEVQIMDPFV
jgi:hypothetical protein